MYAVGFYNRGKAGMQWAAGNNGLQKLHNKTIRGWQSETQTMKKCVDEIFIMRDFTQEMCEMNSGRLWEYCYKHKVARI